MNIGIVGVTDDNFFKIGLDYAKFFSWFGEVYIIPPTTNEKTLDFIDLLVMPGGSDVNPLRYTDVLDFSIEKSNPFLEYADTHIFKMFVEKGKPIVGICRGIQAINVGFGGTLIQDLIYHGYSAEKTDLCHKVSVIQPDGKHRVLKVNSFHHQSIDELGKGLVTLGTSLDGIIEIIGHETLPIVAFQFHPEMAIGYEFSEYAKQLIIERCKLS